MRLHRRGTSTKRQSPLSLSLSLSLTHIYTTKEIRQIPVIISLYVSISYTYVHNKRDQRQIHEELPPSLSLSLPPPPPHPPPLSLSLSYMHVYNKLNNRDQRWTHEKLSEQSTHNFHHKHTHCHSHSQHSSTKPDSTVFLTCSCSVGTWLHRSDTCVAAHLCVSPCGSSGSGAMGTLSHTPHRSLAWASTPHQSRADHGCTSPCGIWTQTLCGSGGCRGHMNTGQAQTASCRM